MPTKNDLIEEGKRLDIYNSENKLAVIIGTSPNMSEHIETLNNQFPDIKFDVIAVNKAMFQIEKIDHWVSMHPLIVYGCKNLRAKAGFDMNFKTHTPLRNYATDEKRWHVEHDSWKPHIDYHWKRYFVTGGSGLCAIGCAMGMGYNGVILCGMELTEGRMCYVPEFLNFSNRFRDYARTMGGFRKIERHFNKPDKQWIEGILNDLR